MKLVVEMTHNNSEKLPLEHTIREALEIYGKRLSIFFIVVVANLVLLGAILFVPRYPVLSLLIVIAVFLGFFIPLFVRQQARLAKIRDGMGHEKLLEDIKLGRESDSIVPDQRPSGSDIFVVYGHDEAAKESVARFIEKLGLRTVILQEQPNEGRTIIERLEDCSNVGFAIVLLTPDDIGAPLDKPGEEKSRARQNVILELGYFVGKLGRKRVCVLCKDSVEIPSDFHGVLYVPMDSGDAWKITLAKEIRQAGIEVDLNNI